MMFRNLIMLAGLSALAVPIIIHLLNRRQAKLVDWGAMQFLLASLTTRKRHLGCLCWELGCDGSNFPPCYILKPPRVGHERIAGRAGKDFHGPL